MVKIKATYCYQNIIGFNGYPLLGCPKVVRYNYTGAATFEIL